MKSEIVGNQEVQKEREYPWLGISNDGNVVLFTSKGWGVIVFTKEITEIIGDYGEWRENCFKEFKGKLILSND